MASPPLVWRDCRTGGPSGQCWTRNPSRLSDPSLPAEPAKIGHWSPVALTAQGNPWGEYGLNQAFKRAGRSGWTFHSLRHFFVTELFRQGAPAVAIQRRAEHSELATTQLYADVDGNDLRSAIERIDGEPGEGNYQRK